MLRGDKLEANIHQVGIGSTYPWWNQHVSTSRPLPRHRRPLFGQVWSWTSSATGSAGWLYGVTERLKLMAYLLGDWKLVGAGATCPFVVARFRGYNKNVCAIWAE